LSEISMGETAASKGVGLGYLFGEKP
jgi:hypothetical protein